MYDILRQLLHAIRRGELRATMEELGLFPEWEASRRRDS